MWDDHRLLNGIANGLYAVAALLILYGGLMAIVRLPIFPLHEVEVTGRIAHTTRDQVQTIVAEHLEGNFFTLDLGAARAAFQRLPWVRQANVRRQWPDRLNVEIEEHVAVARWRDTALVNTFGEVFEAASNQTLPVFIAPDGTSAEVTQRYEAFRQQLARLDKRPVQVLLSQRRAWTLKLDDGDVLELGREHTEERLQRFVAAYPHTLGQLPVRAYRVDLRYPNGFAVRGAPGLARARGA
ncbi:MAG TPA: cell division protein FtsQ/DivIB [Burkholderiales bacterium]|nr:cell division protein FtsQ/DivIB [Burkholderiales bacterium]